jgi:hypothetical protein
MAVPRPAATAPAGFSSMDAALSNRRATHIRRQRRLTAPSIHRETPAGQPVARRKLSAAQFGAAPAVNPNTAPPAGNPASGASVRPLNSRKAQAGFFGRGARLQIEGEVVLDRSA